MPPTEGPTWYLVADGGRARVFEQRRPGARILELEALAMTAPSPKAPRDSAPRVHESVGKARHAIAGEPPRKEAAETFLMHVASQLNVWAEQNTFRHLVLCAPPHAMGVLRNHLSDKTRRTMRSELVKDFVHESAAEIAKRLAEGEGA